MPKRAATRGRKRANEQVAVATSPTDEDRPGDGGDDDMEEEEATVMKRPAIKLTQEAQKAASPSRQRSSSDRRSRSSTEPESIKVEAADKPKPATRKRRSSPAESTPPPAKKQIASLRRSSRERRSMEPESIKEPEMPKPASRKRRSSPTKSKPVAQGTKQIVIESDSEDDDYKNDAAASSGDESYSSQRASKPRAKKKSSRSSKEVPGRGPLAQRTCPHCNKIMSTRLGLQYHVGMCNIWRAAKVLRLKLVTHITRFRFADNWVCRIEQCTDPDVLARSKRKRGKSRKGALDGPASKRFRGPLETRTCPHCKREFTSVLGRDYHVGKFFIRATRMKGIGETKSCAYSHSSYSLFGRAQSLSAARYIEKEEGQGGEHGHVEAWHAVRYSIWRSGGSQG